MSKPSIDLSKLPKPYYSDDAVVIYNADCRDILPLIPDKSVDLVLTDPPYENLKGGQVLWQKSGVAKHYSESRTVGDLWDASLDWVPEAWRVTRLGALVFTSFHGLYKHPTVFDGKIVGLICWYKRNSPPSINNAPHYLTEYIWAFKKDIGLKWRNLKTFYDIPLLSSGCITTGERFADNSGKAIHPTQKPVALISRLLEVGGNTILDPFLGSGTTAYCAKKLGRLCIGIEIEEKYCEIAAKRCSQMVMQLETEKPIEEKQGAKLI